VSIVTTTSKQSTYEQRKLRRPNLFDIGVPFAAAICEAETELVASIFCDPVRSVPIVRDLGIRISFFKEEDLRILAAASFVAADRQLTKDRLLRLASRLLKSDGWWDDNAPVAPPFSCRWSAGNLQILANTEFFCRPVLHRNARNLIDLLTRKAEVRAHLNRAGELMEGPWPRLAV